MMPMLRIPVLIGLGLFALAGLFADRADGQKKVPIAPPVTDGSALGYSSVKIIEDSTWRRAIEVARDCILDKEFNQAIEILQKVLDESKDRHVKVIERDANDARREVARWTSVKHEANRLIGSMPAKGLQEYETAQGEKARTLLDDAKKKKIPELLAEVAQRYRHTKAGIEANKLLAKSVPADAVSVNVKDWPSWRGNLTNTGQATGSSPLLDKPLWSRPLFNDVLDGFKEKDPDELAEARIKSAIKQVNDLKQPVMSGFFPVASQGIMVYRNHRGVVAVALKNISFKDEESGVTSKYKPGQIIWKSIPMDRSLATLLEKPKTLAKTQAWLDAFDKVPGFNSFLYDNTLLGTMVTDQRHVYMVNDLAVPPHPSAFVQNRFQPQLGAFQLRDLKPLVMQNELYAYDLMTGKLTWDLNHEDPQFKDSHFISLPISVNGKLYVLNEKLIDPKAIGNPFGDGRENPIGGESELRLICLDSTKLVMRDGSPKPTIVGPIQVLGNVMEHNRMVQDVSRRVNAVQLAYSDGVLVCPTNAGEVFGIDLMTRSLAWTYPYRENPYQPIMLPGMQAPFPGQKGNGTTIVSKWKSAPPAIQAGKLVFTAPDADSVHCVNLRDGKPLWKKAKQKGDLYLAGVFDGLVAIVGETSIRALDLRTGGQLWSLDTGGLPSGQGAASDNVYYLPLMKGEVLAVDLVKGVIQGRNRAGAGAAPGNLVFYENMVLSQTATEVAAYPQLRARLKDVKLEAVKDPDNLAKLAEYGDLLLKDGQILDAVETLRKVYERKPADPLGKHVKERLFAALTDLLQTDFNKASKEDLKITLDLCTLPEKEAEKQIRKATFFRLVGQGREAQGDLIEAFQMYKDFGAVPILRELGGVASADDPAVKVPVNIWLRGRISGMLAGANVEQRARLDAKIAEEWRAVEAKKDVEAVRSFVSMFDASGRVGCEARVRLALSVLEKNDRAAFLEAELLLIQVLESSHRAEAATSGRALAALASLAEKRGTIDSVRQAAAHYRELARTFAKDPVRGTKTGADLLDDLLTDARFRGFLVEPVNPFAAVKFAAKDLPIGDLKVEGFGFVLTPHGEPTLFTKQNLLLLDPSDAMKPKIRLRDRGTFEDRWQLALDFVPLNQQVLFNLYQQNRRGYPSYPNAGFRFYHAKGNLVVCQVGVMVYGLDVGTGKKLWELPIVENQAKNNAIYFQQVLSDRDGNPELAHFNQLTQQTFRVPLGRIGTAQATYVAVLDQKGLSAINPLSGVLLWRKPNVSIPSHVFGDEQHVFVAAANDSGEFGVGRVLRASDGEAVKAPDFGAVYQARIRVIGRHILASQTTQADVTVRLYDILAGKDVWSKAFAAGSSVLQAEDRNITGIIEPNGLLTVLDAHTGKVLVSSSLVQGRITLPDVKGLREPLLLQDGEHFYVALNQPIDTSKVFAGLIHPNFSNGTRCLQVNGWFAAVHRHDGKKGIGAGEIKWKKGDFAWHSHTPLRNQMIVLEQFDELPILVFTAGYNETSPNGANKSVAVTQSVQRSSGKMIYDSGPRATNGVPMYVSFRTDPTTRTISLVGYARSVLHYIDEGKGPPPLPR